MAADDGRERAAPGILCEIYPTPTLVPLVLIIEWLPKCIECACPTAAPARARRSTADNGHER
jgi:hypothetical protein